MINIVYIYPPSERSVLAITFFITEILTPFHNERKKRKKVKLLSRVRLFATPWTGAYQAPLSMEFSKQEYWSGLPEMHGKMPSL